MSGTPAPAPYDDDAFLNHINADLDERAVEDAAALREQAEYDRIQREFERVIELLNAAEAGAPRNGKGVHDEPPPFDSMTWAILLVELAQAWKTYYANFGELPRPRVSAEWGHDAGHRVFMRALDTLDARAVDALIDRLLPPFRRIGKTVHTKAGRFDEGIHGWADYFHVVAFDFGKFHGDLQRFDAGYLPGKIVLGTVTVRLAPHRHGQDRPAEVASAADAGPSVSPGQTGPPHVTSEYQSSAAPPALVDHTLQLDEGSCSLTWRGTTVALRSTARLALFRVLGAQPGKPLSGPALAKNCHTSDAYQLVRTLKERFPDLSELIQSSRDGYCLLPTVRVVVAPR